jgi:Cap4 SAVED domain
LLWKQVGRQKLTGQSFLFSVSTGSPLDMDIERNRRLAPALKALRTCTKTDSRQKIRDVSIDNHAVKVYCHCLTVDANGRVQLRRLAEFMRNAVADYAIPCAQLAQAKARDAEYNSTEAVATLVEQAKRSLTGIALTGEGGEMLLFLLAERFLKLPQILCKMDLKTDTRMHYHGADGGYVGVTSEGILKLYWGESKVYGDVGAAIRVCLSSLAPFLIEPDHEGAERERDLILLADKADLSPS